MASERSIRLEGKIFISGDINAVTGLHIGGTGGELDIGGIDNPVIRNSLTREPYIPGSSLRGKMRSLLDRHFGNPLNNRIGRDVSIYAAQTAEEYRTSVVSNVFGVAPRDRGWDTLMPTRLLVRDVLLTNDTRQQLDRVDTDFTEVKTEVAIDRITSAATPRQNERVPAGAIFGPFELVYSLYTRHDDSGRQGMDRELNFFGSVLTAMELLEDDYLGGGGSRGSGQIAFDQLQMSFKSRSYYQESAEPLLVVEEADLFDLRRSDYRQKILAEIQSSNEAD